LIYKHCTGCRLVGQRTAVINQIRGFLLEHGIAVRQGLRFLRQQLPDILAKRSDVLSPRMIRIIEDLSGDWRRLDERIEHITEEIEVLAHGSESCRQLMTVPGIGPLIASAMVAAIGNATIRLRQAKFTGPDHHVHSLKSEVNGSYKCLRPTVVQQ
jgi:transposase